MSTILCPCGYRYSDSLGPHGCPNCLGEPTEQQDDNAMQIDVYTRHVYGRPLIYPANEAARTLAAIAGVKTLSQREIDLARELGHTVNVVPDPAGAAAIR